ncbi:MAG: hypothetical protein V4467_03180 [Patescibacteria group bacterium]
MNFFSRLSIVGWAMMLFVPSLFLANIVPAIDRWLGHPNYAEQYVMLFLAALFSGLFGFEKGSSDPLG